MSITSLEFRILVTQDDIEYEAGDAEDAEQCAKDAEDYGVWGFTVESRLVVGDLHSDWQHVDSCFGYIGTPDNMEYMMSAALDCVPEGQSVCVCREGLYQNRTHVDTLIGTST